MNIIVYSKEEGFEGGVKKLGDESSQCGKTCEIIEIKELPGLLKRGYFETIQFNIYFLSSDYRISHFIDIIKKKNQTVVNEAFLIRGIIVSKFESLERVRRGGIHIPRQIQLTYDDNNFLDKLIMPVFIKSKSPRGLVIRVNDKKSLNNRLESLPEKQNYYLEENVKNKDNIELKIYYINGDAYAQEICGANTDIPSWFRVVLDKISKCTELDVFSADFFIDWGKEEYYCFDINHASSFYKSEKAREVFISKILK